MTMAAEPGPEPQPEPESQSEPEPHPDRAARQFLYDLGAGAIHHPGGTLLAHLDRVRQRLADWDARPALRRAGLCHVLYGTDGFAPVLLPLDRRERARAVIGPEAESLVYLYASCDRKTGYPALTGRGGDGLFRDRFTGRAFAPTRRRQADFAELTVANELDIASVDSEFRAHHGPGLLELFTGLRPLLTPAAWEACAILPGWTY
ncbi:biphenyl-2,3-diol 1,2-dioxygenase III-related protein [Streptomyces formicae]|uniref:Biphenyl-2,3-diol 1,2-dioxygenase III-related protein n=2 Tax=Streptomyces formicae TaxID=1616117 RepID=A0A291QLQ1_9ACTN|nr:hypothetical protein [Streptomyces formicae]ATL32631.1 biphenyl-2,3-diol 1,2-dioxygenase III-related protein [Streptomyces formicae]